MTRCPAGGRGEDRPDPRAAVERVRAVADADCAAVYLLGPEADELRLADVAGGTADAYGLAAVLPLTGGTPVVEAVRSHRPLWLDAVPVAPVDAGTPAGPRTGVSLGAVPLVTTPTTAGGAAAGCLVVVRAAPGGFGADRHTLLELYADHLSALMGAIPPAGPADPLPGTRIGTFVLDRRSGRIEADPVLLGLFGVAPETFDGYVETLVARTLLDDLPTLMSVVGRSGATFDVRDLVFRARRPSGEPRWLRLRCRAPADRAGRPGRVLGAVADALVPHLDDEAVEGLRELPAALADATTVQEVGRAMVERLTDRLGADRVAFAELSGDRLVVTALNPPAPAGWPEAWRPDERTEWLDASLSALPSLDRVLRSGRTTVWPAAGALESALADVGPGGLAVLPLSAEGRVIGACLIGWDAPHPVGAGERSWLTVIAGRAAEAVVRAQALDTGQQHLRTLQTSLLPHGLPKLPGAVVAARYLPATAAHGAGGDWYDVITTGGHLAVVVGDVQGHDAEAATIMGQVSMAIRAYSAVAHPPDVVLAHTNRLLLGMSTDLFVTCCYISLDVEEGNAWLVRAGHPPPLLRLPGGGTRQVEGEEGPPLGVTKDAEYPLTSFDVPPGAVLALLTDGLVRSARLPVDEGMRRLCDVLGAADPADVGLVADEMIAGADRRDDAALLLLRYDGLALRPVRASWNVWRLPEAVMHARRFTARRLRAWGVSEEADTVQLVVSELVTNAVVHTRGEVRLDLTLSGDRLRVAVTDALPRAPVKPRTMDWESTGGRGIMMVEALSAAWGSVPMCGGKQVWSEIALDSRRPPEPAPADKAGRP
ncbi:SpoIIE family protein phosphatase [Streptomyces sp. NPDC018347]|uniref:SpoIIE family protein phosphatase n=1 Tax=Streptomyces sp. NPDC018347 TaxID=3157193 RepID=UPI0033EFA3EB